MSSFVLSVVGSTVGGALGGPLGASIGGALGQYLGGGIDNALFGGTELATAHGARLSDLMVQTSTYGKVIPQAYGTVRIGGNIIWAMPIAERETRVTQSAGGKGGGGRVTQTSVAYSYYATFAVALCEGAVESVLRIWADAAQVDLSTVKMRLHRGAENQMPDPVIEAKEGVGRAPAYRGLAYVVFEDFPLADYGNRIPNFTFEVKKKVETHDLSQDLEGMVRGICLIPGAGEYVYDTEVQYKSQGWDLEGVFHPLGYKFPLNMHNQQGVANVQLALDQLQEALPALEWVSVVVTWFGTSVDAGNCTLRPGVEFKGHGGVVPDEWQVAGLSRAQAYEITHENGIPRFGGTPTDASLLRLMDELKGRGLKVMLYPMFFIDTAGKPWRGEVTGSINGVEDFFTKANGYNAFINHYANLTAGRVDGFVIGSELKGLTAVQDGNGYFPAVDALVNLAAAVKGAVGSNCVVTYAADWSEYHHTEGGWYQLDPLWASPHIDVVGIDAYFPLTDGPQAGYDLAAIEEGWFSGEGYDFYYTDSSRMEKAPLDEPWAWKNLQWWWENYHTNPDSAITPWQPAMKPVWFTEYGFPSVDNATNQPNVFYDAGQSHLSGFPYHSHGRVDFLAQRAGLLATERVWKDSPMIERMFIWAWDARPYPYFPDMLNVWADGGNWKYGHWVNGKIGTSGLAEVVRHVLGKAGFAPQEIDVSRLDQWVDGFVITQLTTPRAQLELLGRAYGFDIIESEGMMKAVPFQAGVVEEIAHPMLVPLEAEGRQILSLITRQQEMELPATLQVYFLDKSADYQQGVAFASREATGSRHVAAMHLPVVMSAHYGQVVAEWALYREWMGRVAFRFQLPRDYLYLEVGDVVMLHMPQASHVVRIIEMVTHSNGTLTVDAMMYDQAMHQVYAEPATREGGEGYVHPAPDTRVEWLELPVLPHYDTEQVYLAAAGEGEHWRGAVTYRSDDGGQEYQLLVRHSSPAVIGMAVSVLGNGVHSHADRVNHVDVALFGSGAVYSCTREALLNGANLVLVGEEVLQFKEAQLLEEGVYRLSHLLRGRLGTEYAIASHAGGERVVVLDNSLAVLPVTANMTGVERLFKTVSVGKTLADGVEYPFRIAGRAFRPYAPVHIRGRKNAGGTWEVSWVRRARKANLLRDYVDVPLDEAVEQYEVEVLDGAVVKRVVRVPSTLFSYSSEQQVADFGTETTTLSLRICQLSAIIGRGYAAQAVLQAG